MCVTRHLIYGCVETLARPSPLPLASTTLVSLNASIPATTAGTATLASCKNETTCPPSVQRSETCASGRDADFNAFRKRKPSATMHCRIIQAKTQCTQVETFTFSWQLQRCLREGERKWMVRCVLCDSVQRSVRAAQRGRCAARKSSWCSSPYWRVHTPHNPSRAHRNVWPMLNRECHSEEGTPLCRLFRLHSTRTCPVTQSQSHT